MNVNITRVDATLPLPTYETEGSVGFDLLAREDVTIPANGMSLVPNNIVVEVPAGYMLTLAARSSTPMKRGLILPNGIGVIDIDYSGPDDEVKTLVYNLRDEEHTVKRGDKISQGIFVRVDKAEWNELEKTSNDKSRGGFGSTGGHNL